MERPPLQVLSALFDRSKLITLSVHLCLQHNDRDAGRREAVRLRQLRLVIMIIQYPHRCHKCY